MAESRTSRASFPLSERESEILRFVARGLSNKEIAGAMRVSPSTVKRHLENIFRKLRVKNRVEGCSLCDYEGAQSVKHRIRRDYLT